MVYKDVTSTSAWVDIVTAGDRDVGRIREIIIENASGADAVVQLRDEYIPYGSSSASHNTILERTVTNAEKVFEIRGLKGLKFIGKLQIQTDQQPLKVTVGIEWE